MTTAVRRVAGSVIALLASGAVILTVLVAIPTAASADEPPCIPEELCMGDDGSGNGPLPGTPGPNPGIPSDPDGDGGGGGCGTGCGTPDGYFSSLDRFYGDLHAPPVFACRGNCGDEERTSGPSAHYGGRCLGGNQWGDWDGVETFESGIYQDGGDDIGDFVTYTGASYDCISAAAYTIEDFDCIHRWRAWAIGPVGNPEVAEALPYYWPDTGHQWRSDVSAFSKSDRTNPALCRRSYAVRVAAPLTEYGKYQLDVVPEMLHCKLKTYYRVDARTSVIPDPEVINCMGPIDGANLQARAQLFCEDPGWTSDWSGHHLFTTEDCLNSAAGIWNCGPQVDRLPRFAGEVADPVGVLDDGKDRRLRWRTVSPEGSLRNIEDEQTRLQFRGGSPYRTSSLGPASSDQPFVVNPTIDSWVHGWGGMGGGGNTDFMVNFQAPGSPDAPWTARSQWKFTAEFLMTQVSIDGWFFDPGTGVFEPHYSTTKVWKRMPARCNGQPAEIDVSRARNASN